MFSAQKEFFKNKFITTTIISNFFNILGTAIYNIVLIQFAASLHGFSKQAITLASIASVLPYLFRVIPGRMADNSSNRRIALVISSLFQAIVFIVIAWIIRKPTILIFIFILIGNFISDLIGTYKSSLYVHLERENVPSHQMEMLQGYTSGISSILELVGQSLGMIILVASGYKFYLVALINAASYIISGLVWLFVDSKRVDNQKERPEKKKLLSKSSFSFIKEYGQIYKVNPFVNLGQTLIVNFNGSALETLAFLFLIDHQIFTGVSYGFAIALISGVEIAGSIIGSFVGPHIFKNISYFNTVLFSAVMDLIFLFTFFVFHWGWLSVVLLFFTQISNTKTGMLGYTILINNVKQDIMGELFAKLSFYQMAPILAGVAVIPSIGAFSMNTAVSILIGLAIIGAIFSWYVLLESKKNSESY
ncbi:MAG: MFS transporter [Lactobacillaceae bacterium]|jgi:MFS family permease|nr:MFS transporter [Lactobacillaceae bacterium]